MTNSPQRFRLLRIWLARIPLTREGVPAFAQLPFRWAVRLHNSGRRAVAGIDVRDGDAPQGQSWFVTALAPAASITLCGEITYPRRGLVDGQALILQSGHPVGLV